jgi:hypothetical protein
LIAPWEEYFLKEVHDLPIEKGPMPHIDLEMKEKVCLGFTSTHSLFRRYAHTCSHLNRHLNIRTYTFFVECDAGG